MLNSYDNYNVTQPSAYLVQSKSLAHIQCYHCHEFGHYRNACPDIHIPQDELPSSKRPRINTHQHDSHGSTRQYRGHRGRRFSRGRSGSGRAESRRDSPYQPQSEAEVNVAITTDDPLSPEDIKKFMDDLPPFEDISIDPSPFALLCEVLEIPSTISQDGNVGTASAVLDSNIIVHDVVDNSHLFLTPDTHCIRRVVDPDELEPSLCRVVHPHGTGTITLGTNQADGLVGLNGNILDLGPADRIDPPLPGDYISTMSLSPPNDIPSVSSRARSNNKTANEGLSWVVHPGRLESAIRVVHPRVVNPIEGSVGLATADDSAACDKASMYRVVDPRIDRSYGGRVPGVTSRSRHLVCELD